MEVHVHGSILLKAGTTSAQIEEALRPWLDYIDEDNMADARSVHPDEPGLLFDRRRRVLELCWTGDVGRSFHQVVADALASLNAFAEEASAIDISYYLDDGQDEYSMVFVGPTPESIHEAQRARMVEDVQNVLTRHFTETEVAEVTGLVNQLFERNWKGGAKPQSGASPEVVPMPPGRKHLH